MLVTSQHWDPRTFKMGEKHYLIMLDIDKNTMLVREFDKYILEHPGFAEKIPDNALVVMQIVGDEEFNEWARRSGQSVAEEDNPIVYITVTELKPVRSRIEKLKVEMAA